MTEEGSGALWIGAVTSVLVHVALGTWLLTGPTVKSERLLPTAVSIEVVTPIPPPRAPEPRAPQQRKDPKPKISTSTPRESAPSTPESAQTPEPVRAQTPAAPLDLSGITLTGNGSGPGFPQTNGSSGKLQLQRPTRPASVQPSAPRIVSAADLSERPKPPALDGVLAAHYPAELRRRGISGQAIVSARLESDGVVRSASVVSESEPGFGSACRQTLLGSRWSPPRDRTGQPVATRVSYTCRFRVDH